MANEPVNASSVSGSASGRLRGDFVLEFDREIALVAASAEVVPIKVGRQSDRSKTKNKA